MCVTGRVVSMVSCVDDDCFVGKREIIAALGLFGISEFWDTLKSLTHSHIANYICCSEYATIIMENCLEIEQCESHF